MFAGLDRLGRLVAAAGATTIAGVVVGSKLFTNAALTHLSPGVFSPFGLLLVVLWGAMALAAAPVIARAQGVAAVLALAKAAYVSTWVDFMLHHAHKLPEIASESFLTALFYASYGPVDCACLVVFATAAVKAR